MKTEKLCYRVFVSKAYQGKGKTMTMYRKHVNVTYELPFGSTIELPTLAQVLSVCINPEDSFVIEQDGTLFGFVEEGYYWNHDKLKKELKEYRFTGDELVCSMTLQLDIDEPDGYYYTIHVLGEADC